MRTPLQSRYHHTAKICLLTLCLGTAWGTTSTAYASATAMSVSQAQVVVDSKMVSSPPILVQDDADSTVYLPLGNVSSLLNKIGVGSSWSNGSWRITPATSNLIVPAHPLGEGSVRVYLGNEAVARFTPVTRSEKANGKSSVYVPVSVVVSILRMMHQTSYWVGQTLVVKHHSKPQALTFAASTNSNSADSFTMSLTPNPQFSLPATAVPPVAGNTTLTLPRYPGWRPALIPDPWAYQGTPASPYTRTGEVEYVVPADASKVQHWYSEHMQNAGYGRVGTGGAVLNPATGAMSAVDWYAPRDSSGTAKIEVDLTFLPRGAKTEVTYWATAVVTPPRPASSFVPTNVTAITVSWQAGGSESAVTLTDPSVVSSLVRAVNALTTVVGGINPGGPAIFAEAKLTFDSPTGQSTVSANNAGLVVVKGIPLMDPGQTVWTLLKQVTNPPK